MKVYYLIFIGLVIGMGTASAGVIQSTETSTVGNTAGYSALTSITNANDTDWATTANFTCGGTPCTPPAMDENYTYNSIWNESYATSLTLEILIEKTDDSAASVSYYNYSSSTYNITYALTNANSGKKVNITLTKGQVFSDGSPIRMRYTGDSTPSVTLKINETKLYWLYNSSVINITFDKETNATVIWDNNVLTYTGITNIYNYTSKYPKTKITISFGNNQIIEFYNDNQTDIMRNVTIGSGTADVDQEGYVFSQVGATPEQRIDVYTAANNSFKLYGSTTTSNSGYFKIRVTDGLYLFVINRTGFDYYSQLRPVSSTNTLWLYLTNGTSNTKTVSFYTNCPLKSPTTVDCNVYTETSTIGNYIRYLYYKNNTWQTPVTGTTEYAGQSIILPVTLSPQYYIWNITIEVNGVNASQILTKWENLTNRTIQITIPEPETPLSQEELPLIALVIMVTAATVAAIVNQYASGVGIYVYAIILSGWAGAFGMFWVPATIGGFMLAIAITKRIVG